MSKVKIGFVGSGFMGQNAHLFNYAMLHDQCEVVALAEPRAELAKKVAARYGIPRIYANHTELLAHEKVDAIIASQPYQQHAILIPDLLRAGVPVFTEKPLALSVEAGERLVQIGEEYGALHMIGYHKRSDPAVEYAKAIIEEWQASGEFGQLNYVRVSMPPGDWVGGADNALYSNEPAGASEREPKPEGMTDEEAASYDVFVNYYIHQVNAIRFMLGESYKLTYAARSGALLVGESDSGKCVTLEMGTYVTSTDWQESILVTFDKGFIQVELPAPLVRQRAGKVTVFRDNGNGLPSFTEPVLPNQGAMRRQAVNFLAAVRGERPAPCTASEALEDLRIARDYIKFMTRYKEGSKV
ncbi:Gfo/Idh/MocA family protein [Paenibacillus sp. R14(2021)]|uniref:Gfo/Idh/MocA family protein n=1 Tax=Paenibacillus sp. R14(2021) TaxID=2859228 RepID=UPI001C616674|nr:Gfo/Idh/MocA family oxidoreductase [Paenibacillus sp. R14(2021)]